MRLAKILLRVLIMAGTASTITCQGNYTETYTNTVTRAVGPTTLTGARGTLPEPSPDDTNSIWLAPNGNDANAGTEALPKLTVAGAIAALGAITNIHIFRNGYVGELLFTLSATATMPSGATLQVEEGEYAVIHTPTGTNFELDAGAVNGVWFDADESSTTSLVVLAASDVDNCLTTWNNRQELGLLTSAANAGETSNLAYSICGIYQHSSGGGAGTATANITNSIVHYDGIGLTAPFAGRAIALAQGGAVTVSVNITRSWVYSRAPSTTSYAIELQTAAGLTTNIAIASSILLPDVLANVDAASGTVTLGVSLTNCLSLSQAIDQESTAFTLNDTVTVTSPLSPATPPLLINQADWLGLTSYDVESANLLRLQIRGKTTPDGTGQYFISSPLYQAGVGGVDINPWDETVTGPVRAYGSTHTFELAPATHSIEPEFVGEREVNELNGGSDQDFDAIRRIWKIAWTPGRDALNNDWKRLQALQWDKSRKKVYLRGVNGNFLDGFATQAVFDDTDTLDGAVDGSFALQSLPTPGTISMNWYNFWLEVVDGSVTYEYWISSNDGDDTPGSKLYIVDKLGMGLPANGTYDVAIRYFIASLRLEGQPLIFDAHRPGFLDGQRWAEAYDTGSVAPETDQGRFQGKGFSLILVEQTDPKAAPS